MADEYWAILIAVVAVLLSAAQWFHSWRNDRVRLLLGEKEAVAFEAIRLSRSKRPFASDAAIRALLLATLLESSTRVRLQLYNALDNLEPRYGRKIRSEVMLLIDAAIRYQRGADLASFRERMSQLATAVAWVDETNYRKALDARTNQV
ncbi:hypothetical protein [Microbacterium sp. B35-30]|uniref:hypothetical protein n=1 Tax=Microbacterium sp. B35-30 TaxID=1962642 RepID=UPI0013D3DF3E|nr:hypothetical protein [Microbacterium sp. B35-30]KAF2415975.1 hypothetical protein B2K11_17685 [Microbacterium sp. B35-30]